MKKFLLLLSVFALFSQNIDANPITVSQATAIAKQFGSNPLSFRASNNADMQLNYVGRNLKGQNDYYVFNRGNNEGFVIVAGDDMSTPVLGYSDKGAFDFNEAPEPMRDMLVAYQARMDWLRQHPQAAQAPKITYDLQPYGVYPICGEVHWHQFPPYNNNCPTAAHALTSNGRCYAGCTTVALATIMKGLRHPSIGFGENSYTVTIDGKEVPVSAKFNDYSYRYSNMRNGYGENAYNAQDVSELMYEVAVALNTRFSAESSDAYIRDVYKAMVSYFDFNTNLQYVQKSNYSYNVQGWYDMIYTEIDGGRPVYMFGYRTIDNSGNNCHIGHAFVLDGYDKDGKVHVNWGFQPEEYNTYFELDMLSPRMYSADGYGEYDVEKSGFNADQAMLIGICPDTTGLGGVVVKQVNLVADVMPANDLRATIDVQALSGPWSGTLRYGIVSKNSEGAYSPVYSTTADVEIDDNGIATLDLSGAYPYYLYEGRTYYIVVWSPYFIGSYDWNWFLGQPVPFTVGDWVTPPEPEVTEKPVITSVVDEDAQTVTVTATGAGTVILYNDDVEVARGEGEAVYVVNFTEDPEGEEMGFSATAQEEGKEVSEPAVATVEIPGKPVLIAISEVYVNGYESPVGGENAADHLNITVPEGANYVIDNSEYSLKWRDNDANEDFFGVFVAGTRYSMGMTLAANEGYYFAENCKFYVNGSNELVDNEASYVTVGSDRFAYLWTLPEVAAQGTQFILGDVNNDGEVNISDVTDLIDYLLNSAMEINLDAADIDGGGEVNISDVTDLIDMLLRPAE